MRNSAREAALTILFAQQFNESVTEAFKKSVYKQFELVKEEDLQFAKELIAVVEKNLQENIPLIRVPIL